MRPTLILAPLPEEIRPLRKRLDQAKSLDIPRLSRAWRGSIEGRPTIVAVTGDGERNALRGVETAMEAFRPSRLLAIGVAGALTPDLEVGDVLAARQVLHLDDPRGHGPYEPSPGLLDRAGVAGIPSGTVLTTSRLVSTPAAKTRLAEQPGLGAPAVVDLESAIYARAAEAAGMSWLVLRAVSDTVTESLPAYLERCRDKGGAVRRGRVALHALMRPWTIPALTRLARNVDLAAEALAEHVASL